MFQRVQRWRKDNPGYWQPKARSDPHALQDSLNQQPTENTVDNDDFTSHTLQDLLTRQASVLIGIIAQLTGSALQEDIASARRMQQLGIDIRQNPITLKEANMQKHPIYPERIRTPPKQFSWVDHRLVRDHYIDRCSHQSAALYLFLVTVADAQGLSYYSDRLMLAPEHGRSRSGSSRGWVWSASG